MNSRGADKSDWGVYDSFTLSPGPFECLVEVTAQGFLFKYDQNYSRSKLYEHRFPFSGFNQVWSKDGASCEEVPIKSASQADIENGASDSESRNSADESNSDSEGDDGSSPLDDPAIERSLNIDMSLDAAESVVDLLPPKLTAVNRDSSVAYWAAHTFEPIVSLRELVSFRDIEGNTSAHHAAFCRLPQTFSSLVSAGSSKWLCNKHGESPYGLISGIRGPPRLFALFKACRKRKLLDPDWQGNSMPPLTAAALRCDEKYNVPPEFADFVKSIDLGQPDDAIDIISSSEYSGNVHQIIYKVLAMVLAGYSTKGCLIDIETYTESVISLGADGVLDPVYFFVLYLIWKMSDSKTTKVFFINHLYFYRYKI